MDGKMYIYLLSKKKLRVNGAIKKIGFNFCKTFFLLDSPQKERKST